MDDLVTTLLLALGVAAIGWLLGIAGYFKARRALEELAAVRAVLERLGHLPVADVPDEMISAEPELVTVAVDEPVTAPYEPSPPLAPPPRRFDVEELLTAKWGVWLGAAALLLAGVFLVRYAADEGLLGPGVRAIGMVLLAAALVGGAEWLARHSRERADEGLTDYAPQALAAGGGAILFGAAYLAGPLYGLVMPLVGFALLAAAGLAAMALSLRFGPLAAAVGIIGAFITPLLVQTGDPFLPGLFVYLFCVATAALGVMRYTAWTWVGWATTLAGAAWVLLSTTIAGPGDAWAAALFVPAVTLAHLLLLPGAALDTGLGRRMAVVPVAVLGLAALLLALAVPSFGTHAGVLLLAPITILVSAREKRLDHLPWLAAGLFLLLLLGWGLPDWRPADWYAQGQPITTDGVIMGFLPGTWAPEALQPLLLTAAIMAALFIAAGLGFERRSSNPLRWASLAAAVPVLALAILYLRIKQFQPDALWSGAALLLALGSTVAAGAAMARGVRHVAGTHAAGAAAALALACAMLLTDQWLTLAFALFLPALAGIEARTDLPALRRVALAAAWLAIIRLMFNPYVLDYAPGALPLFNSVTPVYLLSAAAFAASAGLFRRRQDDLTVAVLELAAAGFITALVMLEIRRWATAGAPEVFATDFLELALHVSALAIMAAMTEALHHRFARPTLGWTWRIQGALALAGGCLLILLNPALTPTDPLGATPIVNALLPAYGLPALAAGFALRRPSLPRHLRGPLACYALVAAFVWITLEVRHLFHPDALALADAPVDDAELWAFSGAWMGYGLALMAGGILAHRRALRLAAMAIVALAAAKVFLIDMSGLTGLWRVLSLLGLGLTLIALGAVYQRFVVRGVSKSM